MFIQIHYLNVVIDHLTPSDVDDLTSILGIPYQRFTQKRNYKTDALALRYAFGDSDESVYLYLGNLTRLKADGRERYHSPRLTLHGSFFDNSPDFRLDLLLEFLCRFNYNLKGLDIAYCDDQSVTKIEDWQRVFGRDYKEYCLGNMLRRSGAPRITEAAGRFESIKIGLPTSKSSYATLYRRPDGLIRFEIKYRDTDQINFLLTTYVTGPTQFHEHALSALISQVDIITPSSKRTKNPRQYVRVAFYQAFLASKPSKLKWGDLKKERQRQRVLSERERYVAELKRVMGGLNNFITRSLTLMPLEDVLADMMALAQHPLCMPRSLS